MKKSNFLIDKQLYRNITPDKLAALLTAYHDCLDAHPVKLEPEGKSTVDVIKLVKRQQENAVGPYQGITLFEALNRIATDLVAIHGLWENPQLLQPHTVIHICMGNEEVGDFSGDILLDTDGVKQNIEVFNASPSFFPMKLRATRKKWRRIEEAKHADGRKLDFIFFNGEIALSPQLAEDTQLIGVNNWDKAWKG